MRIFGKEQRDSH
jgi:hypothetical protein